MSVVLASIELVNEDLQGSLPPEAADPGWDIPGIPRQARADSGLFTAGLGQPTGRASRDARRKPLTAYGDPAASSTSSGTGTGGPVTGGPGAAGPDPGLVVADPAQALAALTGALDYLAHAEPGSWPAQLQADCLRALAAAESRQTAVHDRVLAAFSVPGGGLAADGHRSPRVWLTWQTRATRRAAAAQVGWMRRLTAHPVLAQALAEARVPVSWARQVADWTGRLPEPAQAGADAELLSALARGAGPAGLAAIAEDQRRQHAAPDQDDDGFQDRAVRIGTTFGGAGRIEGDLTPRAAAAVTAVLESLSKITGPEDDRSLPQRQHDALEEACTRLIASGMLPQRAGQPVHLTLPITLQELLRNQHGAGCDALVEPVITGHLDYRLLEQLASPGHQPGLAAARMTGPDAGVGHQPGPAAAARTGRDAAARRGLLVGQAIALLSGPAGRAAALRRTIAGAPAIPVSLPLDVPATFDTIPLHLRRAVRQRDRHCRFPGCDLPPAACDIHHLIHRKDGGPHALHNLVMLCRFHHLIAIHAWGWTLTLNADGTTTAASPDHTKILHSHAPPIRAA